MEELKITKERVIAAAKKCHAAEQVLTELFPEVFRKPQFRIGQHFTHFDDAMDKQVYVLAMTGNKPTEKPVIRLININTGRKLLEDPIQYDWAGPNLANSYRRTPVRKVIFKDQYLIAKLTPVRLSFSAINEDLLEEEEYSL